MTYEGTMPRKTQVQVILEKFYNCLMNYLKNKHIPYKITTLC